MKALESKPRQAETDENQDRELHGTRFTYMQLRGMARPCRVGSRKPQSYCLEKSEDGVQDQESTWKARRQIWEAANVLFLDICGGYINICFRKVIERCRYVLCGFLYMCWPQWKSEKLKKKSFLSPIEISPWNVKKNRPLYYRTRLSIKWLCIRQAVRQEDNLVAWSSINYQEEFHSFPQQVFF